MYTMLLAEKGPDTSLSWLFWLLLAFFVLMVIIGWWVSRKGAVGGEESHAVTHPETQAHETAAASHEAQAHQASVTHAEAAPPADDLTIIEGIGPKVASILKEAGITTFAQLASSDPTHLEAILRAAKLQMMDPQGWIEQARLAAQGDWEGLKKLQDELKGGRRR
jgi:large subunit ribosomal protein L17